MSDIPSKCSIDGLLQKVKIADDTLHDALAMAETVTAQQKDYASIRFKLTATEEKVFVLKKRLDELEYEKTMQNREVRALKEECKKLAEVSEAERQKCIEYDKCLRDMQQSNQEVINYKDSKIQDLENDTVNLKQKIASLEKLLGDHNTKIREATELRIKLESSRRKLSIAQRQLSQAERKRCETAEKFGESKEQELERQKVAIKMKDGMIKELEKDTETNQGGSGENQSVPAPRKDLRQKYEEMRQRCETAENSVQSKDQELERQKSDIEMKDSMIKELEKSVSDLEEEMKETRDRADKIMKGTGKNDKRLSEMAGRRLTDNNPKIADLSDVNRPTKLAEKYAELYDNEWTYAYEYLETLEIYKGSEISVIASLFTMLSTAYKVSLKTADKQLEDLRNILNDFHGNNYTEDQHMKDLLKELKDLRKKTVQPSMELKEEYSKEIKSACPKLDASSLECGALRVYLQKCLELCWLMVKQDPPVHLNCEACKKGDPFDKNMFKEYTQPGPFIKFTVWPAVYLEKGGALLCKGVVQCDKQLSGPLRAPGRYALNESRKSQSVRLSGEQSLSLLPSERKQLIAQTRYSHAQGQTPSHPDP